MGLSNEGLLQFLSALIGADGGKAQTIFNPPNCTVNELRELLESRAWLAVSDVLKVTTTYCERLLRTCRDHDRLVELQTRISALEELIRLPESLLKDRQEADRLELEAAAEGATNVE